MSANAETTTNSLSDNINPPHIEFLYFATCSNAPAALALLHDVLRAEGILPDIEMIAVETEEAAQRYGFFGSPTIRVNGVDVVPPLATAASTLACRLYIQADGSFAPYPPAEALIWALRRYRTYPNT